jgi:hypothetical protein
MVGRRDPTPPVPVGWGGLGGSQWSQEEASPWRRKGKHHCGEEKEGRDKIKGEK